MAESSAPKLKQKLICYIDDSKTSAFVTKKILQQAGYHVDHFPDAESAIEAILDREYSFVVTDLMISADGGVNGDDLINIIRRSGHPIKSLLPIVVVTSASDKTIHQSLLDAGANAVLVKPLDAVQFENAVKNFSKTNKSKPTASPTKPRSPKEELPPLSKNSTGNRIDADMFEQSGQVERTPSQENIPTLNEPSLPKKTNETKQSVTRESFFFDEFSESAPDAVIRKEIKPKQSTVEIPLLNVGTPSPSQPVPETVPEKPKKAAVALPEKPKPSDVTISSKPRQSIPEKEVPPPTLSEKEEPKESPSLTFDDIVKLYDIEEDENVPRKTAPNKRAPKIEKIETKPRVSEREMNREITPEITPEPNAEPAVVEQKPKRKPSDDPLQAFIEQLEQEPEIPLEQKRADFQIPKIKLTPQMVRYLLIALAALFAVPPLFVWLFGDETITVDTFAVTQGPIFETISVPGKVVSNKQISVTSFFPGQVTQVLVKEGESVTKGQVLVKLDERETRTKVNRAEAHLISMKETVASSAKTLERLQKALNLGAVSRQMVEDAEANWKSQSAKQSLAEEELKEVKLLLERAEVKAPFDGVVSTLYAQTGQMITPPDPILKLVDIGNTEIELKVDASDSSVLREGQVVVLRSDAFPGKAWTETINRISTTANRDSTANMISVFTTLGKEAPQLKVGQQIDADIRTSANNRALLIPFEAVKTVNGSTMVAVEVNSRVHYVPIQTGIESLTSVEVVQGLSLGQRILLPGGLLLEEGQKIAFRNP